MEDPAIQLLKGKIENRQMELSLVLKEFYRLREQVVILSSDIVRMTGEIQERTEKAHEVR